MLIHTHRHTDTYINRSLTTMDDDAKHVVESSRVTAYTDQLVEDGFDSLDALATLEEDDLAKMMMKTGHARVFLGNIRKACSQRERAHGH